MTGMLRSFGLSLAAVTLVLSIATSAAAETHVVRIVSDYENLHFAFEPPLLVVQPGDTVTWVNDVAEEHNVITYPGGYPEGAESFQSPYLSRADETFSREFQIEGTYQYHCLPHLMMGMKGEIVVGRRTELGEFHQPSRSEIAAYRNQLLEWFDEDDNLLQVRITEKRERRGH